MTRLGDALLAGNGLFSGTHCCAGWLATFARHLEPINTRSGQDCVR